MLLMLIISCSLHGYSTSVVYFLILISIIWIAIFEYIRRVFERKSRHPLNFRMCTKYMALISLFALINPVLCLMLVIFFHPFYLSRCLGLTPKMRLTPENASHVNPYRGNNDNYFSSAESHSRLFLENSPIVHASSSDLSTEDNALNGITTDFHSSEIAYNSVSEPYEFSNQMSGNGLHGINPASGLPMIGDIDIKGDPYGVNSHMDV